MKLKNFDGVCRLHLIDEIRGFCIVCMVLYHMLYTMTFVFSYYKFINLFNFFSKLQPLFASIFIIISGFCCVLSKSNLIRGLKLFIVSILITLFTALFSPQQIIVFGILHMLSISMIFYGLIKPAIIKIPEYIGIIFCIIFFILTYNISLGKLGPFSLPLNIYKTGWLFPFGIYNHEFYSSDYFPLFPWIFIFLLGSFIGSIGIKKGFLEFIYKKRIKLLSKIGKHTLLIYIVHQPIIYVIIWFVKLIIR